MNYCLKCFVSSEPAFLSRSRAGRHSLQSIFNWLLLSFRVQTYKPANEVNVVFLYGHHYAERRVVDLMYA